MVYATGVGSPATTEFFRAIGANDWHFGLISGLPMAMLLMQFVGAAAVNRAVRRKKTFMTALIACRLLYLPVAFLPLVFPGLRSAGGVTLLIGMIAVSAAVHNYAVPFWFSWMADVIPGPILNRFWGMRQRWMHATWTAAFLLVTVFLYRVDWPATRTFPLLAALAVAAGVADIALFARVREPANARLHGTGLWASLAAPLRHAGYRPFVLFSCYWAFATMFAAAFMQLYVLKELGLAPWHTALVWCLQGVGVALTARRWGRMADRHAPRPVLNLTVYGKSFIALVFLLLTPRNVVWLLPAAFLVDGTLNSGYMVARNGFMLKLAPRENRSMFIAAVTGLAGLFGGAAAMLSGAWLRSMEGWEAVWMGRTWGRYHLVFAASLVMRWIAVPLVRRVREPNASRSRVVLYDVLGQFPMRFLRFPVGLYRRIDPRPRR